MRRSFGAVTTVLLALRAAAGSPAMIDVFHRYMSDSANVSYFCFRIPALVRTTSGALIAFAEGRHVSCADAGDVRLVRRISNDEGKTWSEIEQVKAEPGHTIGNPMPIVDAATGDVHLLYCRDNKEVFATRSRDGGLSWGPSTNLTAALRLVLDPAKPFVGTGPPGGIQIEATGRLIGALYYTGLNGTRSAAVFSDDHGSTWRRGDDVPVGQTPLPNASSVVYIGGESQVARYAAGGPSGLVMLMRVRGDFGATYGMPTAVDHNHATAVSTDGGETWSTASLLHATTSYCEGSVATVGGHVLISAPSTTNGGRANLTLWWARRAGGRFRTAYASTIYPRQAAYSSMLAGRAPGTLLTLFERDNDPYVPKNLTLAVAKLPTPPGAPVAAAA